MARVVVSGYLVRNPLGGYAWQAAHYLLGVRALGHEVWFYEDTSLFAQAYNPVTNAFGQNYEYGVAATAQFLVASLEGAILMTKVSRDIGVMEQCVNELKQYLSLYDGGGR